MKRERNTSITKSKKKKQSSSSSSESSSETSDEKPTISTTTSDSSTSEEIQSSPKKTKNQSNNISVRLQNTDMFTKYKNKNAHIIIEPPKTTSNCLPIDLSDDDEIWLCEIPSIVNVNELVGKSIKLGSKKCFVKTDGGQIECASEKYESHIVYENSMSLAMQDNDGKFTIKNLKPIGRLTFRAKADELLDNPLENAPAVKPHQCTLFPENIVMRHPLHGRQFEDRIKLKKTIQKQLKHAQDASMQKLPIKQENTDEAISTVKKSKKRKADTQETAEIEAKKIKTEIKVEHDDDLSWIKSL